jgi:hypothetical protein
MMAGTERGKEVRLYYIKIRKAWNTPELVMVRAQQMGATLNWKEPSAAKTIALLRVYNQGLMTPNEYRRRALNLPPFEVDAPLNGPAKPSKTGAAKQENLLVERDPDRIDSLAKFIDENLEFTGNGDDFVPVQELYERYQAQAKNPYSRWNFIYVLKASYPIIHKQKKINGYPALVIAGCKFRPLKE